MKNAAILLLISILLSSTLLLTLPSVKAARTITVPDDYPTITSAVDRANDGDTVFVRSGNYDGPINGTLKITKSISLIGENAATTKLTLHPAWYTRWLFASELSGYENSLEVNATGVVIEGFTFLTQGWNMNIEGDGAQLRGNILTFPVAMMGNHQVCSNNLLTYCCYPNGTAKSFGTVTLEGNYSQAANNVLDSGCIGIGGHYNTVFANSGNGVLSAGGVSDYNLIIGNTLISGSMLPYQWSDGIHVASCYTIVANNTVSGALDKGISVDWGYGNTVCSNTVINCSGGLYEQDNSGSDLFFNNDVVNCSWGAKIVGWHATEEKTTLYHNNFVGNTVQVNISTTEYYTTADMPFTRTVKQGGFFDNDQEGNYWSDYNGVDANGDGIGDTPYVIDGNRSDNHPLMKPYTALGLDFSLPDWANLTMPTEVATPSVSPQTLIVADSSNPETNPNPTAIPTDQPAQTTAPTNLYTQEATPNTTGNDASTTSPMLIIVLGAVILAVPLSAVILFTYLKKKGRT